MPKLQFYRLSIFGKEYNIYHFLRQDKDVEVLELDYSQNFFNLSFVAVDYINGNNYTYSYMIDGAITNFRYFTQLLYQNIIKAKFFCFCLGINQ